MYLCVDVGGTKTLLAAFTDEGELTKEVRFETPAAYSDFLEQFESNLKQLQQTDFRAAAVAIPGQIDRKEGIGLSFGNLSWKNVPVQADIERISKAPVMVENDAKAGAIFEAVKVTNEFKRVL
jgi:glucokinase